MSASPHDYFTAFAYRDPAAPEGTLIEFPISVEVAVQRTGVNNANLLIANPPPGWMAVFAATQPDLPPLHYLHDGQPVFNEEVGKWVQTFRIVEMNATEIDNYFKEKRRDKELEINAARTQANDGYFPYMGKRIACDPVSMKDIMMTNMIVQQIGALPPGFPSQWKARDNTYVPMPDATAWRGFFLALYAQGMRNFQHSETLKFMISQATSLEQIEAISWNTPTNIDHT